MKRVHSVEIEAEVELVSELYSKQFTARTKELLSAASWNYFSAVRTKVHLFSHIMSVIRSVRKSALIYLLNYRTAMAASCQ